MVITVSFTIARHALISPRTGVMPQAGRLCNKQVEKLPTTKYARDNVALPRSPSGRKLTFLQGGIQSMLSHKQVSMRLWSRGRSFPLGRPGPRTVSQVSKARAQSSWLAARQRGRTSMKSERFCRYSNTFTVPVLVPKLHTPV